MVEVRWPSIAAIASSDMPRFTAWVARVCRSWCGWMCGSPAAAAAPVEVAGDRVPIQRGAVRPGDQPRDIRRHPAVPVVVDQPHQLGVQRKVPVLAQLADRHVQPVPRPDLHDRVVRQGGVFADPQPGAQQYLHADPHQRLAVGAGRTQ
jgi:hypothetical protein